MTRTGTAVSARPLAPGRGRAAWRKKDGLGTYTAPQDMIDVPEMGGDSQNALEKRLEDHEPPPSPPRRPVGVGVHNMVSS